MFFHARKLILSLVVFSLIFQITLPFAFAQNASNKLVDTAATLGVARMIETTEKNVKDGSILTASGGKGGAVLSALAYDPQVIGVVSRDAAIILDSGRSSKNAVPVISVGQVYLLVSTKSGPIKRGDLLTTSTIPGIAVKAVKDGYVLGSALEDYTVSNAQQIGKIAMELNLHYYNSKPTILGSLTDIFKIALLPTKDSPTPIFKYLAAAAVVISSFVLTFLTFGRTAAKGVEALGRNPAASKMIHLGIIFNIGICVAITLIGLFVAFLILRL